jgi:transcriptional regulator with XRE-family HTH domain
MDAARQETERLIKNGRLAKGYTQMELAEHAKVSLRSIQRIENAEVTARAYTLKILAATLEIELPVWEEKQHESTNSFSGSPSGEALVKKILLSVVLAICLVLFGAAFIAQSARFPETSFEMFMFCGVLTTLYFVALLRLFKTEH